MRLLIVEDEWLVAEDHAAALRGAGYDIVGPVASVAEAAQKLSEERIDLAILDVGLIGGTSYSLADSLAARKIPFVFVTGYAARDLPPHLRNHAFLSKPAPVATLLATVQEILA